MEEHEFLGHCIVKQGVSIATGGDSPIMIVIFSLSPSAYLFVLGVGGIISCLGFFLLFLFPLSFPPASGLHIHYNGLVGETLGGEHVR